jgi:hypothetical protein
MHLFFSEENTTILFYTAEEFIMLEDKKNGLGCLKHMD